MRQVERDYRPTLIVGVRTGGLVVAECMARHASATAPVLPVTNRHAPTDAASKMPMLRAALGVLPRPTVNLLRRIEHRFSFASRSHLQQERLIDHREVAAVADWLARHTLRLRSRVLVADEAVDSGVTLTTVVRHIAAACPAHTEIRTAALAKTMEEPAMQPDYCLFENTRCRFPRSFDARPSTSSNGRQPTGPGRADPAPPSSPGLTRPSVSTAR